MIRSQINPTTMDFYSESQNFRNNPQTLRHSNIIADPHEIQSVIKMRNQGFNRNSGETEDIYTRNQYNKFGRSTFTGNETHIRPLKKFINKNTSVSMHNLNNFGYLIERIKLTQVLLDSPDGTA